MQTNVNAWDCTCGCTDTVRESALKVDSGRKIPRRTGGSKPASATCRSDALPTELHPHVVVVAAIAVAVANAVVWLLLILFSCF